MSINRVVSARLLVLLACCGLCSGAVCQAESRTWIVAGQVRDEQARPVAGAEVVCYENDFGARRRLTAKGRTQTDADGNFSIELDSYQAKYILVGYKPGLALGWKMVVEPYSTTLILGQAHGISGVVVDEAGQPLSKAGVQVVPYNRVFSEWADDRSAYQFFEIGPKEPKAWFFTETDDRGRFAFDHLPQEAFVHFTVRHPDKALLCTHKGKFQPHCRDGYPVDIHNVHLVMLPKTRIQGVVTCLESGERIPGVSIKAVPQGDHRLCCDPVSSVSNEQGQFEFQGLVPDSYKLLFEVEKPVTPQWIGQNVDVQTQSGRVKTVDLTMTKGAILEVTVYDQDHEQALEGASVRVYSDVFNTRVKTDEHGVARVRVLPGECSVEAYREGYGGTFEPQLVTLQSGEVKQFSIDIVKNGSRIACQVLTDFDRDFQGVMIRDGGGGYYSPDQQGLLDRFQGYSYPTRTRVDVMVRDVIANQAVEVSLRDPNHTGVIQGEAKLQPATTLVGKVCDPDGEAISSAYVALLATYNTRLISTVATDANGVYRIPAIPASFAEHNPMTLIARVQGYGTSEIDCPKFTDQDRMVQCEPIMLQPMDQQIAGVVLDANDLPVSHAKVWVLGPEGREDFIQPYRQVRADEQGRFTIKGLCKGPLRLCVDGGYLDAYGGLENLKVIQGRQLIYEDQPILQGQVLKDLTVLGCDSDNVGKYHNQPMLICFFDMNQRPSRRFITKLNERIDILKRQGIQVVAVQTDSVDQDTLDEWITDQAIAIPIWTPNNPAELRQRYHLKTLPWLIRMDASHGVLAEGLTLDEI